MKVLVNKYTHVVIDIREVAEFVENGISVGDCIYAGDYIELHDVADIPTGVKPQKSCYKTDVGFYDNLNYVPPESEEIITLKQRVADLELQISQLLTQGGTT
ncbi:MAG: hypothetical protein APF84_05850 [Gracilibacter sp. BRH_c7a]|nr:MAG: hypothetical protein APF84_05850 [Gracilibacter sp. BRH_c7a]